VPTSEWTEYPVIALGMKSNDYELIPQPDTMFVLVCACQLKGGDMAPLIR
jgi:hypothetical protein